MKLIPAAAALIAASALVLPTVSHAQEAQSARVPYADLDLGVVRDQTRLQVRIKSAASNVCGYDGLRDTTFAPAIYECRSVAIAGAQPAFQAAVAAARHGTVTVVGEAAITVAAPR